MNNPIICLTIYRQAITICPKISHTMHWAGICSPFICRDGKKSALFAKIGGARDRYSPFRRLYSIHTVPWRILSASLYFCDGKASTFFLSL